MKILFLFFILIIELSIIGHLSTEAFGTVNEEYNFVWYGYENTGYFKAPIIYEIEQCNNRNAVGCLMGDTNKYRMIIVAELYDPYGCTLRIHEWFHLMGYEEWEIPRCGNR